MDREAANSNAHTFFSWGNSNTTEMATELSVFYEIREKTKLVHFISCRAFQRRWCSRQIPNDTQEINADYRIWSQNPHALKLFPLNKSSKFLNVRNLTGTST